MAQGSEVEATRALVLDANIMLRGVFGTRVRTLIERYSNDVSLFTSQSCVDEVREYIPPLYAKRGWDPAAAPPPRPMPRPQKLWTHC
jgi:PIN domain-containing protein